MFFKIWICCCLLTKFDWIWKKCKKIFFNTKTRAFHRASVSGNFRRSPIGIVFERICHISGHFGPRLGSVAEDPLPIRCAIWICDSGQNIIVIECNLLIRRLPLKKWKMINRSKWLKFQRLNCNWKVARQVYRSYLINFFFFFIFFQSSKQINN